MELTAYERETIINYNEAEQTASVYTHNRALRRTLDKLAQERPEDCRIDRVSHEGAAADYLVPKSWVKIRPPRIASEAQKAASRAAAAKAKLARKNTRHGDDQGHGGAGKGNYTTKTKRGPGNSTPALSQKTLCVSRVMI